MLEETRASSSLKRKDYKPLEQPPSKAPRADHEEVLHLTGIDEKSNEFMWYVLDMRDGKVNARFKMPHGVPYSSTAVAYLNRFYVLGKRDPIAFFGRKEEESRTPNSVFCFDLQNLKEGWTKAPSMLSGRSPPSSMATAFNGKIYVFGGSRTHFAEVLDIGEDSWAELQRPPFHQFGISKPVLLDSYRSRILVHFLPMNSLYAYSVTDQSWECLDDNYGEWSMHPVVVDGVIYTRFIDRADYYYSNPVKLSSLCAYDVDEKRMLPINFLLEDEVMEGFDLFHLGNNRLCIAGYNSIVKCIKYTTFSVYRSKNSGEIFVTRDPDSEPLQSIPLEVQHCELVSP